MLADGGGLYLLVAAGGSRSWIYRYRQGGRLRDMGLGPVHTVNLAEAREKARLCRLLRLDGGDPLDARSAQRSAARIDAAKAMTFRQCAEAYIAAHRAAWRNPKHAAQWPATLAAYVYPVFGSLPVAAVDTGLVAKAIEPIWATKPETAGRVRGRIESVLDWAATRGYRTGANPARWRGHLENLLPARSKMATIAHHAALPYAELPAFMAELRRQQGAGARALEFAILTAARTGEVIGAAWPEIDLSGRLWTIPAARMKGGREHRVPLADAALAILEEMPPASRGRIRLSRRSRRPAAFQHGALDDPAPHGAPRSDRARVPLDLRRLVRRADEHAERGARNGARPCRRRQGRSGLSARRPFRQAPPAGRGVGAVLLRTAGARQRRCFPARRAPQP